MKYLSFARLAAGALLACLVLPAWPQQKRDDLTQRSLEDLMNIEVTSVAKKAQKMSQTASAVFVITQDDILRSGVTNIPDLLRMVPGVNVAQINANSWAISVRGFNGQYSSKLLVLIDGRTVYTPIMSGVFWDGQDVPLDSIDRIEVIRGPGAAVWGANAVNGVINIITKPARDTQGGLFNAAGGTYERALGAVRYGGNFGNNRHYRVSADGFAYNHLPASEGRNGNDDWQIVHGGFRIDANASTRDSIILEGDAHRGKAGEILNSNISITSPGNRIVPFRNRFSGWNLLTRWDHVSSPHSQTSLQASFDRNTRGEATYGIGWNTFDLDFQHHVGWGERHDFVWGLGYRISSDKTLDKPVISFNPALRTSQLFSSFVQDEITVLPDRVHLSLGAKLEHNDYTGFSLQPSASISWTPSDRDMFWVTVSQADRTPARSDTNMRVNYATQAGPNGLPLLISFFGNPKFKNEVLLAVQGGYRAQLINRASLDGTVFFNRYRDVASAEPGTPFLEMDHSSSHLVVPISYSNLEHGETHGLELSANLKLADRWSLSPGYSFWTAHFHRDSTSQDLTTAAANEGGSPNHQAQLRSHVDLPGHWGWNTSAYFVGRLPAQAVPSYTRLDTNIEKQLTERFSIVLGAENLLKDRHLETNDVYSLANPSLPKRSISAKIVWQF